MHTAEVAQATTIYIFTGQGSQVWISTICLLLHVWSGLPRRCCGVSRTIDPNMCTLEYHRPLSPKHLCWINLCTHQHATHKLVGTGSFTQCLQKTAPLLNKNAPCLAELCLFDGMHVPPINFTPSHFIGVSEYWALQFYAVWACWACNGVLRETGMGLSSNMNCPSRMATLAMMVR